VVAIPEVVRNKASAVGAEAWLDDLPSIIADLEARWQIQVGEPFTDATEAFVASASDDTGRSVVLKLLVPRYVDAARHEATVLELAAGEGCVELLRYDETHGALLLERLGPSMHDLGLPFEQRIRLLTDAASKVWRPAPHADLPTGAEKGRWLVDFITRTWDELDRPCSERAIEHALACAERRIEAHDDERAVLVHGDVHEWNALSASHFGVDSTSIRRGGFKLVDPDGLLAEAEYDLGILMREDPVELLDGDPFDRAELLADLTGLDAPAIWEWGVVERVSTGLLCTRVDLQPIGRHMLHAADAVASDWPSGAR
jgi:streptomycin 6-kinase